jgi:hypothetical protein
MSRTGRITTPLALPWGDVQSVTQTYQSVFTSAVDSQRGAWIGRLVLGS